MARYDLNVVLKEREAAGRGIDASDGEVHLDDLSRVKVLSPGRQVLKRFLRNRLAVFGFIVLMIMFIFSFLVPLVYPYGQTQIFYKYDTQNINYALAKQGTSYNGYDTAEDADVSRSVLNMMNSHIKSMIEEGVTERLVTGDDGAYVIREMDADHRIYSLSALALNEVARIGSGSVSIGTYDSVGKKMSFTSEAPEGLEEAIVRNAKGADGTFTHEGVTYTYTRGKAKRYAIEASVEGLVYTGSALGEEFETRLNAAVETGESFTSDGTDYVLVRDGAMYSVCTTGAEETVRLYTSYTVDTVETGGRISDEFRVSALSAIGSAAASGKASFTADGVKYQLEREEGVWLVRDEAGDEYAEFNTFAIRRYSGEDSMEYRLKKALSQTIDEMIAAGERKGSLNFELPMQNEDSTYVYDDAGNLQYQEGVLDIERRDTGEYVIRADQINFLIDRYASPSAAHLLGTDGDGFDVLSRVMYGGRVSLLVGFVVVFLEIILGVIMGGLAGYYGGWVDMLIMRLVDIFYCLPSMPILIILGAMMDALHITPYKRLLVLMAILGILGWAGVARMVRGQILSLREQEFMTATEATGIKVRRRIFSHLVPNVMPQLIVIATLGIGGVIITESTLSFLGLGVKFPLATWGTIINSVSSATAMAYYAHIWIPVGLLICLTVIAFNFVGDGLRDAYDPKSKR